MGAYPNIQKPLGGLGGQKLTVEGKKGWLEVDTLAPGPSRSDRTTLAISTTLRQDATGG